MNKIIILGFALILSSCSASKRMSKQESTYWINSFKVPCEGVGSQQCMLMQKGETLDHNNWQNFYGSIIGFDFEYGFIYKLKVKEERLDPDSIPADASTIRYSLIEVVEKNFDNRIRLNDKWALETLVSDSNASFDNTPQLEFKLSDMRFGGDDGCNRIFGQIDSLTNQTISFGPIGSTLRACPSMTSSRAFTQALNKVNKYKLKGLNLYLQDSKGLNLIILTKAD
jgi:heat shock protein HslJ